MQNHFRDKITSVEIICNWIELGGVFVVLLTAFFFQFMLHELPCPLCLLQRFGFFGIAFGFLLNLKYGLRPSHYSIVLLSAIYTSLVALRQIALHVVPGSGAYGDAFLGLHFYTWSFVVAMIVIIVTTLMLGVNRQYHKHINHPYYLALVNIAFASYVILLIANIISIFMICGLTQCPDNPTQYLL